MNPFEDFINQAISDSINSGDYEVSGCPVCGSSGCDFPKACQDAVGEWPDDRYGEE